MIEIIRFFLFIISDYSGNYQNQNLIYMVFWKFWKFIYFTLSCCLITFLLIYYTILNLKFKFILENFKIFKWNLDVIK